MAAAIAVEAAGEQGHYWEMHDALFEHQQEWSGSSNAQELFVSLAGRLGRILVLSHTTEESR